MARRYGGVFAVLALQGENEPGHGGFYVVCFTVADIPLAVMPCMDQQSISFERVQRVEKKLARCHSVNVEFSRLVS
jgi:hypothetical protein